MKRIVLGLAAMVLASIAIGLLPSFFRPNYQPDQFFYFEWLPVLEGNVKVAAIGFVGAYVARVPFVLHTIFYFTVYWLLGLRLLQQIAAPVQPVTISELLAINAFGTAFALLFAILGAEVGYRFVNNNRRLSEAA